MGIISTLLTGGALVGKICQSLSSAFTATDEATNITVSLSPLSIGGVKFMKSNAERNGMQTYAFNSNVNGVQSIAFPNIDENDGGASLLLAPAHKQPIDNYITDNVSPDTKVVIGPSTDAVTGFSVDGGDEADGVLRLSVKGVKIGGYNIRIGQFIISLNTTQLTILVIGGGIIVLGLKALSLFSGNGISAVDNVIRQVVETSSENNGDDSKYIIDVPVEDYGLNDGDVVTELILSLDVKGCDKLLSNNSSALHPVELKLIKNLTQQINASYDAK